MKCYKMHVAELINFKQSDHHQTTVTEIKKKSQFALLKLL